MWKVREIFRGRLVSVERMLASGMIGLRVIAILCQHCILDGSVVLKDW